MTRNLAFLFAILGAGLLLTEGVRLWWFHARGDGWKDEPVLSIAFPPDGSPGVQRLKIKDTRGGKELAFDYGDLVHLSDPVSQRWSMEIYYLEYEAGNNRQLQDIFGHSPEVCLRASGSTLERTLPTLEADIDGVPVRARHLVFRHPISDHPYHVFKLVWLARMEELGITGEETDFRKVGLEAAVRRHAHPPARMILASINGARSDEKARLLFVSQVLDRCRFVTNPQAGKER